MPCQWTLERERLLLLLAVSASSLNSSADIWAIFARILGEDLTPSAVSQKYYKLKRDAVNLRNNNAALTSPAKPTKRKASIDDSKIVKRNSQPKRTKKFTMKEEDLDGTGFSNCQEQLEQSVYPGFQMPFMPAQYSQFENEQVLPEVEGNCFWLESGPSRV